jgi:enamine deaminase RidA (YjgF/YER057c/UK114 family)
LNQTLWRDIPANPAFLDRRQGWNRVETSGQGGWNDELQIPEVIEEDIATAFRNIEFILAKAGATWDHVIHVNTPCRRFSADRQRHDRQAVPPVHAQARTDLDAVGG